MVGEITAGHKTDEPTADAEPAADAPIGSRGLLGWLEAHPLLVVMIGASLIALGHAAWIWGHRHLGGFDPDESGYLAASLRMERSLRDLAPLQLARDVATTGNGVTVPVLSVPFTLLGPRDPRMAMMVQPVLLVLTAVATAGITRRISGPFASIAAGLLVAAVPGMSTATQSYWYGLGATAFLAVAMWALMASDRCTNRWIWWFGVAVGLMCLSRTMTLGYVPAAIGAGLVVAGWNRRRLVRLAAAVGVAGLVAAPWYLVNREGIFGYLLSYGYGERASLFGGGNVLERTGFRLERFSTSFGWTIFTLLWVSSLCVAALVLWDWSRAGGLDRVASELRRRRHRVRAGTAIATAGVLGTAALVSTSNNGVWFELPLVPLLAVVMVSVISAGPRWFGVGVSVVVAGVCAASLAAHWWLIPWEPGRPTAHYEYGFAQYDERFGPDRRDEHRVAAAEWDAFYRRVIAELRPERTGAQDPVFTLSGNMQLFNTNSLILTGELTGWSPRLEVPDTTRRDDQRADHLGPTADYRGEEVARVLVIAEHDRILFTPDAEVADFADQAEGLGWSSVSMIPMPIAGSVSILEPGQPPRRP